MEVFRSQWNLIFTVKSVRCEVLIHFNTPFSSCFTKPSLHIQMPRSSDQMQPSGDEGVCVRVGVGQRPPEQSRAIAHAYAESPDAYATSPGLAWSACFSFSLFGRQRLRWKHTRSRRCSVGVRYSAGLSRGSLVWVRFESENIGLYSMRIWFLLRSLLELSSISICSGWIRSIFE